MSQTLAVRTCDRATSTTKSLLGYGIIAGPVYVLVSLVAAVTRDGFDLTKHEWSLLANGGWGWVQIVNLLVSGLMYVAFAAGLRRALGTTAAPVLVAVFGLGMIGAGIFRADPALGFPPGTPADAHDVSWHGMLHLVCAGIGFLCLVAASFVLARRFRTEGRRGWAVYSRVTGVVFLLGFAAAASGARTTATTIAFTVAAVSTLAWVSAVAVQRYRSV